MKASAVCVLSDTLHVTWDATTFHIAGSAPQPHSTYLLLLAPIRSKSLKLIAKLHVGEYNEMETKMITPTFMKPFKVFGRKLILLPVYGKPMLTGVIGHHNTTLEK